MFSKDIFIYRCMQNGISEEKANVLYKEAMCKKKHATDGSSPQERCKECGEAKERCTCDKKKKKSIEKMKESRAEELQKMAFDVGFSDALRMIELIDKQ